MAKKALANTSTVQSMLKTNSIMVEIGGAIRRITLEKFMEAIQTGSLQLSQYAWAVPLKENVSSPAWGRVGNLTMWEEYKEQMGRYLLTNDGKMAKLRKDNSAYFADGTNVDISKGHIVFHAPRLYYLVKTDSVTGIPYLWGSSLPIGGNFIEAPTFGAFKGYVLSNKLVSKPGYAPTGNQTISAFWEKARANGNDFGLINYDHRRFMMMINLFEYGNPNVQVNIGYGIGGSENKDLWSAAAGLLTGATEALGDACGKIDISVVNGSNVGVNCSRVNLFGIEDAWNWQWEMTQGVYFGNSGNDAQAGTEIFIYEGNRMPTSAELSTHPAGDYRELTRVTSSNWIREMILGAHFDIFAKTLGGGSNERWSDYTYNNTTGQLLLWGGAADYGSRSGLAFASSYSAFSNAGAGIGSRLAYYGTPQIVNGKDI